MKLSCREGMVPGETLKEKFKNLENWGYEGIEITGNVKERIEEIKEAEKESKVKVSTIAGVGGCLLSPEREERERALSDMRELLPLCSELGAVGVIFVPIFGGARLPDLSPLFSTVELEKELLIEQLKVVAKDAESSGSFLLLEPLNRYETHFIKTLADGVEICKAVSSPNLKIMADFFHMNIEEEDIAQSLKQAASYVQHVHLADSTRLLPGYGHTDFKKPFAVLKEIGYDKYMALECSIPGEPQEELPKCAEYLRQCIKG